MSKQAPKVIVLDLDDTIGHFEQVSVFLKGLQNIIGVEYLRDEYVLELFDLWPNIFRRGIMEFFKLIIYKKRNGANIRVIVYTNNMGPRSWTLLITKYIEYKLKSKIFDQVITAYSQTESDNTRSTYQKTYSDLMRITGTGLDTRFIFYDDQIHDGMKHYNINYALLYPYIYRIPFIDMITSYLNSKLVKPLSVKKRRNFIDNMYRHLASVLFDNHTKPSDTVIRDIKQIETMTSDLDVFLNTSRNDVF